jgi:hypothetical protein
VMVRYNLQQDNFCQKQSLFKAEAKPDIFSINSRNYIRLNLCERILLPDIASFFVSSLLIKF